MTDECDRCGRETELADYSDGQYCPVCIDADRDDDAEADL